MPEIGTVFRCHSESIRENKPMSARMCFYKKDMVFSMCTSACYMHMHSSHIKQNNNMWNPAAFC